MSEGIFKPILLKNIKVSDRIKGHLFGCRHYFNNNTMWTSQFRAVAESLRLLSYVEEKKYIIKNGIKYLKINGKLQNIKKNMVKNLKIN